MLVKSVLSAIPIVNIPMVSVGVSELDDQLIRAEKTFDFYEVSEIVDKSLQEIQKEHIRTLEGIRDLITRMEDKQKNGLEEYNEKLREKNKEIARLNTLGNQAKEELEKKTKTSEERIRKLTEQKEKETQALRQQQKALQSKEKAEYEQINEKYKELEAEADNDKERLELANRKITEYIALIYQKDDEHSITITNYTGLFKEFEILTEKLEAESNRKQLLSLENKELENKAATLKGQIELITNKKDREITDLSKALEVLDTDNKEKDTKLVNYQERLSRKIEEYNDLKNNLAPKPVRKLAHWIDWSLGTDIETSTAKLWNKGKIYGRLLLFFLILAVFSWIASWILRLLVAVFSNIKAIFTKKQDTASILKELVSGMKKTKDSNKIQPIKARIIEEKKPEITLMLNEAEETEKKPIKKLKKSKKKT